VDIVKANVPKFIFFWVVESQQDKTCH